MLQFIKKSWGILLFKEKEEGPPNLDEIFANLLKKKGSGGGKVTRSLNLSLILGVLLALFVLSGFFVVKPAERAVVLRFGRYVETLGSGPHWIPPLIQSKHVVDVQKIYTFSHAADMLTKDENIVYVSVAVWYRIKDLNEFLFQVKSPVDSIQQATASALRQVVGHTLLDDILTSGRTEATLAISEQLKQTLARYHTGLEVTEVTLQPAKPPEAVTAAFDDAIKAREDEVRYVNQAKAYMRKVIPKARGRAARIEQEANSYRQKVVLNAKADVAPYLALLPERNKAPKITDFRLYVDAMEHVLSRVHKVLLDGRQNNIVLLPSSQYQSFDTQSMPALMGKAMPTVLSSAVRKNAAVSTQNPTSDRAGYSDHQ